MKVVLLSSLRSAPPTAGASELGLNDEDELVVVRQSGGARTRGRARATPAPVPAGGLVSRPAAPASRSAAQRVRRAVRAVSPGVSALRFAREVLGPGPRAALDGADLVVAADADTHLAAWLVARRLPRSCAVVAGTSAGARIVAQVHARGTEPGVSEPAS
ncbi:hypothetical protein [Knoellia aerolata]|uniref:Uncharacterized protein n=1 Tax=Knoellia aerolata DSM 18566 TaxID=1385519 RepID=A0A0A0JXW8_9MICO|nr:hypothetical protein [Knoellia aerolata]KGN40917.1 hypothetical protein N801_10675 [Knoellia aerolata DSM 18566]